MLRQLLTGSSVFVLLFAGSLSILAEAQEAKPQAPSTQAAPQPPNSQVQQEPPQRQNVNSQELQQFATVIPKLLEIDQAAQQKITQAVKQSGISVERFRALYQAQRSPATQPSSQATSKERESFNRASTQIQSIQRETQSQQEQAIRSAGIEPKRFGEILVAIRQDPALQQQVQQLIQKK